MEFRFVPHVSLPRLAWCARIARGSETVVVDHGPWVETRQSAFFEGAWDSAFDDDALDRAITLAGSGGRLKADSVVFAGPTHTMDRLYSLRVGDEILVSNSLPFLLVAADDAPDPTYAHYFRDLCDHYCAGIAEKERRIPTARGNAVSLHTCCNVIVRSDLSLAREEKRVPDAPKAYEDYFAELEASVGRVLAHAASAERKQRYRPLTAISRGYDSAAVAVLAMRFGCNAGYTFPNPKHPTLDDGSAIGRRLGMEVRVYDRLGFLRLQAPEPEFHACPRGADVQLAMLEPELAGSVLMLGRHVPGLWSRDDDEVLPDLRQPSPLNLSGCSMNEFRLRVGFFQFNPGWIGAQNARAIGVIARSREMLPWSVGGTYDRPIPRRIAEQAGIPRDEFGRANIGSAHYLVGGPNDLTPAAREDFAAFYRTLPRQPVEDASLALEWATFQANNRFRKLVNRVAARRGLAARLPVDRRQNHLNCRPRMLFTFHWGVDRIRSRYRI